MCLQEQTGQKLPTRVPRGVPNCLYVRYLGGVGGPGGGARTRQTAEWRQAEAPVRYLRTAVRQRPRPVGEPMTSESAKTEAEKDWRRAAEANRKKGETNQRIQYLSTERWNERRMRHCTKPYQCRTHLPCFKIHVWSHAISNTIYG